MSVLSLTIEYLDPAALRAAPRNPRTHSKEQIRKLATCIARFGMVTPVGVSDDLELIFGHARVQAAVQAGLELVPVVRLSHLSVDERRALLLADNQLALESGWDKELLALELQDLAELDFSLPDLGFSHTAIDDLLDSAKDAGVGEIDDAEDEIPDPPSAPVTRPFDIWLLGRHRLACGDARDRAVIDRLLQSETVGLIFTDPPYNVKIEGNVSGLGQTRHRDFEMASGEMSESEFVAFLSLTLGLAAARCRDGSIAYVCMDWRHMSELCAAGKAVFSELKNVCVWNKRVGGMGTFLQVEA